MQRDIKITPQQWLYLINNWNALKTAIKKGINDIDHWITKVDDDSKAGEKYSITLSEAIVKIAQEEVAKNIRELTGKNDHPEIFKYQRNEFLRNMPWCCSFVTWVIQESSKKYSFINPIDPKLRACAGVRTLYNHFKEKGLIVDTPKPGYIAFHIDRKSWSYDHIGIVEEVKSLELKTIEGNSDDCLKRNTYNNSNYFNHFGKI